MQLLLGHGSLADNSMPYYFNVSRDVGAGQANQRDDVYLVQFMLYQIFKHPNFPLKSLAPHIKGDGVFGPKTQRAIRLFQKYVADFVTYSDAKIARDGKIAPATALHYDEAHTHLFTIVAINKVYAACFWDAYVNKVPEKRVNEWLKR